MTEVNLISPLADPIEREDMVAGQNTVQQHQDGIQGMQQGRCFTCLRANEKCCLGSLAFLAIVGGGAMVVAGTQCVIETDQSKYGLDARCIVFGAAGLVVLGLGVRKIGKILCKVFRSRVY